MGDNYNYCTGSWWTCNNNGESVAQCLAFSSSFMDSGGLSTVTKSLLLQPKHEFPRHRGRPRWLGQRATKKELVLNSVISPGLPDPLSTLLALPHSPSLSVIHSLGLTLQGSSLLLWSPAEWKSYVTVLLMVSAPPFWEFLLDSLYCYWGDLNKHIFSFESILGKISHMKIRFCAIL